jgi:hypothetical protein
MQFGGVSHMSTPSAAGVWLGTIDADSIKLRLQFHLDPYAGSGSLDSLDQGAEGIACIELIKWGDPPALPHKR